MSEVDAGHGEEEDFVRPFLGAGRFMPDSAAAAAMPVRDVPSPGAPARPGEHDGAEFVRPYLVTGGRVHDGLGDFSTVYALSASGRARLDSLAYESRQVAELCAEAQSVAEISAHLRLPLGVVTVLARDLADAGYLTAASAALDPASDISLITRLIHAVHAL